MMYNISVKKTVLLFLVSLFFISCASTGAGRTGSSDDVFEEPPLFLDWQYKGFGEEYPQWAEDALKEADSAAITIQFGENLDMLIPHEYEEADGNTEKQIWVYIDPYYEEYEERYAYITLRQAQGPQGEEE